MKYHIIVLFSFSLSFFYSCSSELVLVDNHQSNYKIIVSSDAQETEKKAADELKKYLQEISGISLEIVSDSEPISDYEILIGNSNRLKTFVSQTDFDSLGKDGFIIKTIGEKIIIVGGEKKGTLYGVYTFLEDYLNCRMYAPDVFEIPKNSNVTIPSIDITQIPKIKYRELHIPSAWHSQQFCDWHKLHHHSERNKNYGLFVHTFNKLVPPEVYFNDHPEYFSKINGMRVSDKQLCLTNPDVYDITIRELKRRMAERPEAKIWDVSQNDDFGNCTCKECSKIDSVNGSPSGSLLEFVNKIAKEFPDKTISTLAYQYTRKAPTKVKPEPNVMVVLCTIECDRNIPIVKNENDLFNRDIKEWSAISNNIKIWDYVVQFKNYMDPFPNFHVLQPNIKMFVDHGVKSLFEQGSGGSKSDLHELKAYVLAKLMWNPSKNIDDIIDDFLQGYYGNAAKYVKDYFIKIHNAIEASGESLIIYGYPTDGMESYLTPQLVKEYNSLFDQAEHTVADNPVYLERVKIAKLPLNFAILEISKRNLSDDLFIFNINGDDVTVNQEMKERLTEFVTLANKAGIMRLHERGRSPDEYKEEMLNYFNYGMMVHKAYKKEVIIFSEQSTKYAENKKILTDGIQGEANFHFNWLGFEANEFEAVVDLQKATVINSIQTNFLQEVKSWIWLPNKVEYFISNDGKSYTKIGEAINNVSEKKDGTFTESFISNITNTKARFIKVKTNSLINCPKWHIGYSNGNGKAWIFVDEIVVK